MPTSREIKLQAKAALHRRLVPLLLTALVFLAVNYLITYLTGELTGLNAWYQETYNRTMHILTQTAGQPMEELERNLVLPDFFAYSRGTFGYLLAALLSVMSIPLTAGYTYHTLEEARGRATSPRSLLFGFRIAWKVVAISILTGLATAVGFVFFIVPGVVLLYGFSLSVYVLLDDPSKGILQCMRESRWLMRGNKWRLFKLELSFFFWLLLSDLVTSFTVVPLVDLYLMPYMYLSRGIFYAQLVPDPYRPISPEGMDL